MKRGFTAAELLIAMTIVGVVAALVMPGFMQDYQRKVNVTHLKKVYGLISSAVEQACADSYVSFFKQTKFSKPGNEEEFLKKYLKTRSSSKLFSTKFNSISGEKITPAFSGASIKLPSSESINMVCDDNSVCNFIVDVNGIEKPNIGGRDIYSFRVNPGTNIIEDIDSEDNCTSNANGAGCLQKLINKDWTMDY